MHVLNYRSSKGRGRTPGRPAGRPVQVPEEDLLFFDYDLPERGDDDIRASVLWHYIMMKAFNQPLQGLHTLKEYALFHRLLVLAHTFVPFFFWVLWEATGTDINRLWTLSVADYVICVLLLRTMCVPDRSLYVVAALS